MKLDFSMLDDDDWNFLETCLYHIIDERNNCNYFLTANEIVTLCFLSYHATRENILIAMPVISSLVVVNSEQIDEFLDEKS